MLCTVKKCWPHKVSDCKCDGILKPLPDMSNSPRYFLVSTGSWARSKGNNPESMWQVLLSQVHFSNFSLAEIAGFTICKAHEVNYLLKYKIYFDCSQGVVAGKMSFVTCCLFSLLF